MSREPPEAGRPLGFGVDQVIGWSMVAVLLALLPAAWGLVVALGVLRGGQPLDNLEQVVVTATMIGAAPAVLGLALVVGGVRSWRRARRAQGVERPDAPGAASALIAAAALGCLPWLLLLVLLMVW
ncbi:hypothetical protein [Nocardioides taihuensis]|uniref:Uncharacterized protein n=1 Tax=Nocardioides taihuensis TaxID=1835606 RepID=A0ABW0BER0_9ACTN